VTYDPFFILHSLTNIIVAFKSKEMRAVCSTPDKVEKPLVNSIGKTGIARRLGRP